MATRSRENLVFEEGKPFSAETIVVGRKQIRPWETCPGHEWERIDFEFPHGDDEPVRSERVTRCRICGAPRCGSYHAPSLPPGEWADLSDRAQQRYRCTLHRHHDEPHDYLTGERVPLGG